jgi:hypothetical protein
MVWEKKLLKDMGRRLGIVYPDYDPFKNLTMYDAFVVRQAAIYPNDTLISRSDWESIYQYYLDHAPEEPLPSAELPPLKVGLPHFRLNIVDNLPAQPLTTMVKIDTSRSLIYWGNRAGDLMILDDQLSLRRQITLESPPSQVFIRGNDIGVLTMGIMDPSEEANGKLESLHHRSLTTLLTNLQRPIHLSAAEINGFGDQGYVISQFGNQTGKLSLFTRTEGNEYQEQIIKNTPGAIASEIVDLNQDGKAEIVVLFGQGDERITVFSPQPDGSFKERLLLRFPPVYGSTSFQLADFNGDGLKDILYTNGDNADYSFSLKSYHGARIFINNGDWKFEEWYFYPMNGATKAIAKDFDMDGDLDMFVICFFPDFESEQPQGFVYFENHGEGFEVSTFPEAANGRWLVSDAGDYDGDGDTDIVIGSLLFKINAAPDELIDRWVQHGYQMAVLENTLND